MNDSENNYLDKLFASSSDVTGEAEVEIPLVAVPEKLNDKLYAIAEPASLDADPVYELVAKRGFLVRWPRLTGIAASFLVAMMGFQFYQQQQVLGQLAQAQSDLATALHYLGEANRITREQVLNSLKENMNKAGVVPAMKVGRDKVMRDFKQAKPKVLNRSL